MNIQYDLATVDDVDTLVTYRIRFALELAGNQPGEAVSTLRKNMTEYFKKATTDGSCISFIARSDNQVAGIGSIHIRTVPGNFKNLSGKWGYIMNMYTVPEFRKRGICSAILNKLVEAGAGAGITAFELHATEIGKPVYLKNGFKLHAEPTLRKYV